jgi:hypothetical protein
LLGANSSIAFLGGSELAADDFASFGTGIGTGSYVGPLLEDFTNGDVVDLKNFGFAGATLAPLSPSGVLQLTNGASQVADLAFQTSSLGSTNFVANSDGGSGTLVTLHA